MRWDRPEIAKPILAQIEARGSIQHAFARGTMQRALQAALSLERIELLRLFVASPGFEVYGLPGIAMAQLYRDHAGCALLRSSRELQARRRVHAVGC